MSTLDYIKDKYHLSYEVSMPIILRRIGRHSGIKELFRELGFRTGAEIGTRIGTYARELCIALPQLKLYCIDPWKVYPDYDEIPDQAQLDSQFESTIKTLAPYNCKIMHEESMVAVKHFEPNSLDFVFIDANHEFKYVLDDITQWTKTVRPGGIIFGHDYMPDHEGVMRAIQEYVKKNSINPWFVLHVGGPVVDCWMFVKPEE